ncbi:hypothetical protein KA005_12995 [bacterium]|nr:hypothetical protein [bacterium]
MRYKVPQKKCNLKNDKPIRFNKAELKRRVELILEKEVCQVCETSTDLDYPHHAIMGYGVKDDRSLVNICVECHRLIHSSGGYEKLSKTREEIEAIGWANNEELS